jgi:hypothetical protein
MIYYILDRSNRTDLILPTLLDRDINLRILMLVTLDSPGERLKSRGGSLRMCFSQDRGYANELAEQLQCGLCGKRITLIIFESLKDEDKDATNTIAN